MAFHSFKMILRSNHVRCASVPPEEAIRTCKSPITVPTKAIGGVTSSVPSASLGGATRKWSEESSSTGVSVKNTFISCAFEEDGYGGSAALELGALRESKLLGSLGCGYKFC